LSTAQRLKAPINEQGNNEIVHETSTENPRKKPQLSTSVQPYKGWTRTNGQLDGYGEAEMKPPAFLIVLAPLPNDRLRRTPEARLRAALKALLRGYGLKATKCEPVKDRR